jgi:hypothetical protein
MDKKQRLAPQWIKNKDWHHNGKKQRLAPQWKKTKTGTPVFVFYPLWCQSLFFSIVVPVFVFFHCGASLCFLSIVVPVFVFYLLWCQSLCFSQSFLVLWTE